MELTLTVAGDRIEDIHDAIELVLRQVHDNARSGDGDTGEDGARYQFTVEDADEEAEAREEATRALYTRLLDDDPWSTHA